MSKRDKDNYKNYKQVEEGSGNGQDIEEMVEYKKPGKKEPKSDLKKEIREELQAEELEEEIELLR
ncbi:unnamed protein product, partial [marine sediment metagenome]